MERSRRGQGHVRRRTPGPPPRRRVAHIRHPRVADHRSDGGLIEWVGVHTDITEQRAAEQALRDQATLLARQVHHRERAEAQLRQLNETLKPASSKRDCRTSSGRDEARPGAEDGDDRQADRRRRTRFQQSASGRVGQSAIAGQGCRGQPARRTARRQCDGGRLARVRARLAAARFGRRQALEPKVVNVTRFVQGMDDMLRRAIGEGVEIETIVGVASGTPSSTPRRSRMRC